MTFGFLSKFPFKSLRTRKNNKISITQLVSTINHLHLPSTTTKHNQN